MGRNKKETPAQQASAAGMDAAKSGHKQTAHTFAALAMAIQNVEDRQPKEHEQGTKK